MSDDVKIKISVDDTQASQAFKKLGKDSDNFTSNFQKGMLGSVSSFNVFEGAIAAGLVLGALGKIKDAALAMFDVFVVQGVEASLKYEESLNRLNFALAASGIYSAKLSGDMEALAQKMQETTKFSDDMVLSSAAQLQTLSRLSGEGLQRATKDSADLAAALGIDLLSASELVAKAHEGQTTALRRQGIVISETIAPSEKYAELLRIIETRFGGAAQAQAQTYAGRIEILKNQFDDAQKSIGNYITKNEAVRAVLKVVTDEIAIFNNGLIANKTSMNEIVTQGVFKLLDAFAELLSGLQTVSTVFTVAFNIMSAGWNSIRFAVEEVTAIAATLIGNLAEKVVNAFGFLIPDSVKGAVDAIKEFAKDSSEAAEKSGARVADAWDSAFNNVSTSSEGIFQQASDKIKSLSAAAQIEAKKIGETNTEPKNNPNGQGGLSEAQLAAIRDANIFEAELKKIQDEARAEEQVSEAQYQIAIGQGREADLILVSLYEDEKIEIARKAALTKAANETTEIKQEQARRKANAEADKALVLSSKTYEQSTDKDRIANRTATLNSIATLANSSNQTLASIGKAAAISQATIDGYAAVQKALAAAPPPFNFALAALVGVATASNIAGIAGVKFETGGVVPGLGQYGDQVQARLNPGEVVLNHNQQKELLDVANGRSNSTDSNMLNSIMDGIRNISLNVVIDGREIARTVRDQRLSGYAV